MGNEITLSDSRQIARAAMSWPFDPKGIAPQVDRAQVEAAMHGFEQALIPASKRQKAEVIEDQRELAKVIGQIGNIINPTLPAQAAKEWAMNIVDALAIYPIRVALAAARDAKAEPLNYFNQVHPLICEKAKPHQIAYEMAKKNLERLLREIDNPTPRIEAKPAEPMSDADLQDMAEPLRQLGIKAGWLKEDENGIRWATAEEQAEHERAIARAREERGDRR